MVKSIIILILIFALIGIVVFLDMPKVQRILSLREELKREKQAFSEKQILLAKIEKLTQLYEENEENIKKITYIIPSGQDMSNLIVQLEALALEGGLVLESIDFFVVKEAVSRAEEIRQQEEAVTKDYRTLAIDLKLIGDYLAFKNFLKAVEENIRLMDITSINFSSQSGEQFQLFDFDLDLKTYYQ